MDLARCFCTVVCDDKERAESVREENENPDTRELSMTDNAANRNGRRLRGYILSISGEEK